MKKLLFRAAVLTTAILGVQACADRPTSPTLATSDASASLARGGSRPKAVVSKAIEAPMMNAAGEQVGTLTGTVYLTHIDMLPDGRFLGTARIIGTATTAAGSLPVDITQITTLAINGASAAAATLAAGATTQAAGASCDVVNLVLGPLHLDILGLVVDLNQVVLDVVAQTGAGNLLGNLLCALLGLLDGVAIFPAITQLLEQINSILSIFG
jgi:hypothetical protein